MLFYPVSPFTLYPPLPIYPFFPCTLLYPVSFFTMYRPLHCILLYPVFHFTLYPSLPCIVDPLPCILLYPVFSFTLSHCITTAPCIKVLLCILIGQLHVSSSVQLCIPPALYPPRGDKKLIVDEV